MLTPQLPTLKIFVKFLYSKIPYNSLFCWNLWSRLVKRYFFSNLLNHPQTRTSIMDHYYAEILNIIVWSTLKFSFKIFKYLFLSVIIPINIRFEALEVAITPHFSIIFYILRFPLTSTLFSLWLKSSKFFFFCL